MKPVDSRLPLFSRCAAAQESLNRFVQPGGSLNLSYSARIVEPRPVHGAGAILSHSRSPMALTYLRGHDRGSVSQPQILGSRPLLTASGFRRLVHWVDPGVPILTDTFLSLIHIFRGRHRVPHLSGHVLLLIVLSPSRASTSSILIALSPPVSRSLASAHALALISPCPWAHFPSPTGLSRDMPDRRMTLP